MTTIDVETVAGALRGQRLDAPNDSEAAVFRGIPYAQPPVGDLRFAAPEPATPWSGIREARQFGPAVPQSRGARSAFAVPADVTDSDEYLTVNVWTPDLRGARPIMVWIHGGAYRGGATTDPVFDGTRLAVEGDVVVVTVNHRVGVEGYALLEGAPVNRALLDVIAALGWVRDTIAAFGGDPGSVTVFGQSAGAGAVASLLAMPAARGLFQRAIAQSVPHTFLSPALAADVAVRIAEDLGCAPTAAEFARVDPDTLAEVADRLPERMSRYADGWGAFAYTDTPFSPVVDGEMLPCDPWTAVASGSAHDVPLIVGHTRDEFRLFTTAVVRARGEITSADAELAVARFGPGCGLQDYQELLAQDGLSTDPEKVFETVNADWLFRMPSVQLAQARPAAGQPTYLFELAYRVPKMDGTLGTPHSADNPLIFGNYSGGTAARCYVQPVADETEQLGTRMRGAWAGFAHTGHPGWDPVTDDDLQTMVFDTKPGQRPYPHARTLEAYDRKAPGVLDIGAQSADSVRRDPIQ